jgi:colanic acid/amylovoran biosynthesis protein
MKNKILIVPGNTDLNRGDQALVWESIRACEDAFGNPEFFLYESGANENERNLQKSQTQHLGYNFTARILKHPRSNFKTRSTQIKYTKILYFTWGLKAIFDLFITLLLIPNVPFINTMGKIWLSKEQKKSLQLFSELSAVVVKGGGFLHSYGKIYDGYVMYYFLFDLMLAKRYGVKVIILPNSIGPLRNRIARWLVKRVLSKVEMITVRENVSKTFLEKELGFSIPVYPDLGFYLKSDQTCLSAYLKSKGFKGDKKNIGITLRPYRFDGHNNADTLYQNYLNEVGRFIESQVSRGYNVGLIAQTLGPSAHEDDRLALQRVLDDLGDTFKSSLHYISDFDLNCKQMQKLYSYYDIIVGTRFHSVIFALNENIPCIAIAYGGNKSFGIMEDIGVSDFVLGIESVSSDKLNQMVLEIEKDKNSYLKKIELYKNKIKIKRNELIYELKKVKL